MNHSQVSKVSLEDPSKFDSPCPLSPGPSLSRVPRRVKRTPLEVESLTWTPAGDARVKLKQSGTFCYSWSLKLWLRLKADDVWPAQTLPAFEFELALAAVEDQGVRLAVRNNFLTTFYACW